MKLLELLEPNIDKFGYITQTDGDGGDTAQREGMLLTAATYYHRSGDISVEEYSEIRYRAANLVPQLVNSAGLLRRHPDESRWYGRWDTGSRDQYHIVIGMGLAKIAGLAQIIKGHAKRLFLFASNTQDMSETDIKWKVPDTTGLGFASLYLRCCVQSEVVRPLLWLGDLSLLADSLIWKFWNSRDLNNSDVLNHVQCLTLAHMRKPTFLSNLATKIMAGIRKIDGSSEVNPVQQRLNHYFRPESGGVSGMAVIYTKLVEEVFYEKQ